MKPFVDLGWKRQPDLSGDREISSAFAYEVPCQAPRLSQRIAWL